MLERFDLPDDEGGVEEEAPVWTAPARSRRSAPMPGADHPGRLRTTAVTLLVIAIGVAVIWFGFGASSPRSMAVLVALFGVPAVLAAAAASIVLRRGR